MGSRTHVALAARVAMVEETAATVEMEAVEEAVEEAVAEAVAEEGAARGGARSWQKVAAAGCMMMVAPRSSLRPGMRRPPARAVAEAPCACAGATHCTAARHAASHCAGG